MGGVTILRADAMRPARDNRYLENKVALHKLQLGVVAATRTIRAGSAWQEGRVFGIFDNDQVER